MAHAEVRLAARSRTRPDTPFSSTGPTSANEPSGNPAASTVAALTSTAPGRAWSEILEVDDRRPCQLTHGRQDPEPGPRLVTPVDGRRSIAPRPQLEGAGMTDEVGEAVPMGRTCAWCSYPAPADATSCPSCGAALAQRESIGDLVIPGVTSVRPDLLDADGRALHIPGASNAQGMASGAMIGAMVGGPVGLAAIGGMAVVSAAEYVAASRRSGEGPALEDVGRPIEAAAKVAEQLDRDGETGARPSVPWRDATDPWRDLPG